tara:strand:+ start:262 stop:849 length:588 start_codon:yes stop_codon:yes gene_type:complete
MPDNNPVTKAHQVTVNSVEKGNKEGTSTVTVGGLGQFPTKLSNVYDSLLEGVVAGGTYTFHLERGSRKDAHKDKEGEQDWMFFQNVRRVDVANGASAPVPTQAQPTQDNVVYGTPQHDQYYMRDARIMYQHMNGCVSALAAKYEWDGAMTLEDIAKEVEKTTNIMWYRMYKPLLDGQLPPEPTGADLMPDENDPF